MLLLHGEGRRKRRKERDAAAEYSDTGWIYGGPHRGLDRGWPGTDQIRKDHTQGCPGYRSRESIVHFRGQAIGRYGFAVSPAKACRHVLPSGCQCWKKGLRASSGCDIWGHYINGINFLNFSENSN